MTTYTTTETIEPPLPAAFSLLKFRRVWFDQGMLREGWYLRLERNHPRCIGPMLRLLVASWQAEGGGLDPDAEALAHDARVCPEEWLAYYWPAMQHLFRLATNGRLYFMPAVPGNESGWAICESNRARAAAGLAAASLKKGAAKKAKSGKDMPSNQSDAAHNPSVTVSSPVLSPTSLSPSRGVQQSEEGGGDETGPATPPDRGASIRATDLIAPVDVFVIGCAWGWSRDPQKREMQERELRRLFAEEAKRPAAEEGRAILAGYYRQEAYLTKRGRLSPGSWLAQGLWSRDFSAPRPQQGKKAAREGGAGESGEAKPTVGSSRDELLAWAEQKARRVAAERATSLYSAACLCTVPGWWGPRPPADVGDLKASLLERLGVAPAADMKVSR